MTYSECGFVQLKLHTGGKTHINPHWIVEVQQIDKANPDKGSQIILGVEKNGEPVEVLVKQRVTDIWKLISECRSQPSLP